jgi:hypothetical protein
MPSTAEDIQRQNLPRLALDGDLEGTAANLAIGDEPLRGQARVDHDLEPLPAKRADNIRALFHSSILPQPPSAGSHLDIEPWSEMAIQRRAKGFGRSPKPGGATVVELASPDILSVWKKNHPARRPPIRLLTSAATGRAQGPFRFRATWPRSASSRRRLREHDRAV